MENDTEEKQNYLREMIMEAGYDTDEFINLLRKKKGEDATDIDLWSFSELKQVVNEFIQSHSDTKTLEETNKNESDSDSKKDDDSYRAISAITTKVETNEDHIPNSKLEGLIDDFEYIIKCQKAEISELEKYPLLEIKLTNPEKHPGGFFSKAYITYLVCTEPVGFKVKRRYTDFEWLRNTLQILYPGLAIPPISKKNYGDRFNEIFISKRMRFLEKFMESLSVNEIIKNSSILYDFLTIEKEADFMNKKKEYQKFKAPAKLNEIRTLSGELRCQISKDIDNAAEGIKNYINFNDILLKKLTSAHKQLFIEMNQVSNRMNEISQIYNQLFNVSSKSSDNATVTDTYRMLAKLMNDWGEAERKQTVQFDIELKEYFKYIRHEFVAFKELISKFDMNKNAYLKAQSRLELKKEELFKQGNIARWEVSVEDQKKYDKNELLKNKHLAFSTMMPKDSSHVMVLKENYGYYAYQVLSEFERIRNYNGKRHKTHVTRVSQHHSDILADLHVMWADLLSYYSDIYDSNIKNL